MKIKFFTIVLLLSIFSLGYYSDDKKGSSDVFAKPDDFYTKIKVFTSVLETINRVYINEKSRSELLEDAINGVLSNLDPHTVYLPANDFSNWNQTFDGYSGIGISIEKIHGELTIMTVIEASPAAKVGLKRGDKLLKVNAVPVAGLAKPEAIRLLSGPVGSPVRLTVHRSSWARPKAVNLTRERVVVKSVDPYLMVKPYVGYVRLERFTSTTSRELENALNDLESRGMRQLILDLRGNSGGYLNAAIDVADKFIPGGFKIVSTKGRLASSHQEYFSTDIHTHPLYPMVVLIDHGSASAAEIVAGAIQDLDRGLIIGKSSFGKGLVQSQYRFLDGSALLITTARYYTPSGRPIQRDFVDKSKEEYYRDAYNDAEIRTRSYEPENTYKTLSGRLVHANGGITPDIWVENDRNVVSKNVRTLFYSEDRIFYVFVEDFITRYPALRQNVDNFVKHFEVTDQLFRQFCNIVVKTYPEMSMSELVKDKRDIKFLIKREMAYMLGGVHARFRVNMQRDYQLQAGIRHLAEANSLLTIADLPD